MTEAKGAKYTWDIFYKGKEGFAEHIQVAFDTQEDLATARNSVNMWLGAIEAETLPRDKDNAKGGWTSNKPATPQAQAGVTPVCPTDGAPMRLRSPREGQSWPAFWSCTNYPRCSGKMNA